MAASAEPNAVGFPTGIWGCSISPGCWQRGLPAEGIPGGNQRAPKRCQGREPDPRGCAAGKGPGPARAKVALGFPSPQPQPSATSQSHRPAQLRSSQNPEPAPAGSCAKGFKNQALTHGILKKKKVMFLSMFILFFHDGCRDFCWFFAPLLSSFPLPWWRLGPPRRCPHIPPHKDQSHEENPGLFLGGKCRAKGCSPHLGQVGWSRGWERSGDWGHSPGAASAPLGTDVPGPAAPPGVPARVPLWWGQPCPVAAQRDPPKVGALLGVPKTLLGASHSKGGDLNPIPGGAPK